jgi:hypothetical protein
MSFRAHFQRQRRILLLTGSLAAIARALGPSPPPRTVEGLALSLGRAVGGTVLPSDIAWEPARGIVSEALFGRRLLFLAAPRPGAPRDLYRARVRVTAEGKPIDVRGVHDLTETPLGDESGLDLRGRTAAFATTAFGGVQGVTALDLEGVSPRNRPPSIVGRVLLALSSLRQSGTLSGVGRTDLVFDPPLRAAKVVLAPPRLVVSVEEPSHALSVDLATGQLQVDTPSDAPWVRVVQKDYTARSPVPWAVDVTRSYLGAAFIAGVEDVAFGARDLVKRTGSLLLSRAGSGRLKQGPKGPPSARVLAPTALAEGESGWPPPSIPSLWETPKPGEGKWAPVEYPWLEKLPGDAGKAAPPYFYTTFIRPDPDRPYTEVLLVAMDMRQLELDMEGGYEEPQPLVGPPGTGRIPRAPSVLPRAVAAFNGAFKAEHGEYGMMVDRRILLPPVENAATILVTADGAGFGTWPSTRQIPAEIVSFRQNLDPLLDGSVVNPAGRHLWGLHIAGESVLTERTALCLTPGRHVYYAWGRDIGGPTLARALKQAGCDYAVHLDMNPRHCAFVFMNPNGYDKHEAHYALADSAMNVNPSRYVLGSDKDFFYVMLRNPVPAGGDGEPFTPSDGTQPPPAWLPGIHETRRVVGELAVRIVRVDAGRVEWVLRSGTEEPSSPGAHPKRIGLEGDLAARVVAAIGLGHTTDALRYGLAFDGQAALDLRQSYATVVLAKGLSPRIAAPGERPTLGPGEDAVQLPLLADDGHVNPRAGERGGLRTRGALCVTAGGAVLVAIARHDSSDPLASALVDEGCRRVVALDRGSRHEAFVHRSGTAASPLDRYDASVLYAVGRPMTPRAFRYVWPAAEGAPAPETARVEPVTRPAP